MGLVRDGARAFAVQEGVLWGWVVWRGPSACFPLPCPPTACHPIMPPADGVPYVSWDAATPAMMVPLGGQVLTLTRFITVPSQVAA